MKLEIREIRENDISALQHIFLSVRQKTFTWENPDIFLAEDFDKETDGESVLVSVCGDLIVGFISIWEPDNFIHHLYILSEYQNKNIGERLLEVGTTKLTRPIKLKCLTKNLRALTFYKQLGWESIGSGIDNKGEYALLQLE